MLELSWRCDVCCKFGLAAQVKRAEGLWESSLKCGSVAPQVTRVNMLTGQLRKAEAAPNFPLASDVRVTRRG